MTHEPQVLGQAAHLWTRTSLTPQNVDVAELYDGFTMSCLSWIEALGFCGIGEARDFLDGAKNIARDGQLPLNTHGGEHRPSGLRELLWHPTELYPPEVLSGATVYPGAPPYEDQMVSNWARQDFPALAPGVRIPVQFSVAEHEKVWQCDATAQSEIASMFANASRFQIREQPAAGHNISLGHTAATYHSAVFAFADECVEAQ